MSNNNAQREQSTGITEISAHGYKSLDAESSIEIRPLTVLAGANSSGKSSILQPLLLLKQTLEAVYDPGPLLLDGPNVRFTSAEQLLSKISGKPSPDIFSMRLEVDGAHSLTNTFKREPKKGFELVEMTYKTPSSLTTFRPRMTSDEIQSALPQELKDLQERLSKTGKGPELKWRVTRSRCFLRLEMILAKGKNGGASLPLPPFAPFGRFETCVRDVIHVPGLRGNPERTYKTTAVSSEFPGTFENYVASVVSRWQAAKDRRLKELGDALEVLGLTWKVEAKQVDDTQVELRVGRLIHGARGGAMDMVSIADVGFGVSQTLPVVVALLAARPGQLVYLEQPEIHVHPRAQSAMASVLADAANRGVRVIVETHSSLLLLGIQTLVAEGRLSPDKVKLHWFKRRENGATEITGASLDSAGAFGDWPEDFAGVSLDSESRYLDAAERRQLAH